MKIAIVYYSFEGNTKFIANKMAEICDADLFQIEQKREMKTKGFLKYLWGGRQVMMKKKPDIKPLAFDAEKYDLIILGSPVWVFTFAPAMASFINQYQIQNKKIALFLSHGGGPKNAMELFHDALTGNEIIGNIDYYEPLKFATSENMTKTNKWIGDLIMKKY